MSRRTFARLLPLGIGLSWLALPAAAVKDDLSPLLKAQTVTIRVTREGGGGETGSGVVLCQSGGQVYIVTARHVLYGRSQGDEPAPGLADVTRIEIGFFKNVAPPIVEAGDAAITKQAAGQNKDLLLLTASLEPVLPPGASLGVAPASAELVATRGRQARPVYAIGYRTAAKSESWAFVEGSLLRRGDDLLYHSAAITPGFSGGPLYDGSGALIGINVEMAGGAAPGAGEAPDEREVGRALPIETVVEAIDKWVPAACLHNADLQRELAHSTYRQAMRAVAIGRWAEAERLMREALEELPAEGGSVHLQGMRYTNYLPRYHLGLALYKTGRCAEALPEWERSATQRAISGDKRYRKLRRYQRRCNRALERQLLEATP